jgi:hypothetical protein
MMLSSSPVCLYLLGVLLVVGELLHNAYQHMMDVVNEGSEYALHSLMDETHNMTAFLLLTNKLHILLTS